MTQVKRRALDLSIIVGLGLFVSLAILWLPATAQYPPPGSSLTVTPAEANPPAGSSVTVRALLRDPQGNAVGNADCTCNIVEEPGTNAALDNAKSVTKRTDASGVVTLTLSTGSTPGRIVVRCQSGEAAGQAVLNVQPAGPVLPPTTAEDEGGSGSASGLRLGLLASLGFLTLAALGLRLRLFGFRPL